MMLSNKDERDPFSALMFPSRREPNQEKEQKDSVDGMSEHEWLFGKKRSHPKDDSLNNSPKNQTAIEKAINNVNIPELMNHFDTLMTSAQSLKPLYKQIKPVISSFLNSKK